MPRSKSTEYMLASELQEQILRHVCKTKNSSYKTISKETDRDRITILQSLQPLMKRHYLVAEKIDPSLKKSKLVFKPTDKGVFYALAFLGVTLDDIARAYYSAEEISKSSEFVRNIRGPLQRRQFQQGILRRFVEEDLFDNSGKLIISTKDDYFKQGLRIALLELTKNKYYDPRDLFNTRTIESLKMLQSPDELKAMKDFFVKIRDNLNSAIKLFPE